MEEATKKATVLCIGMRRAGLGQAVALWSAGESGFRKAVYKKLMEPLSSKQVVVIQ
jgi:hypothetical protein